MTERYHRVNGDRLPPRSTREVAHWVDKRDEKGAAIRESCQFRCPCGKRLVYVTSPPHSIAFAKDGILKSLGGSCGYQAEGDRPQNWSHFTITDGQATMHGDSKCPGGDGSIT